MFFPVNGYLALVYVTFVYILLAKAGHITKPKNGAGKYTPATERNYNTIYYVHS